MDTDDLKFPFDEKNWEKKRHCVWRSLKALKQDATLFRQGELSFHSAGNGRQGEKNKKEMFKKKKIKGQIQPEQLVASCITQVLMDKGNLEIENHHYHRMFKIVFIFILMLVYILKLLPAR